MLLKPTEVATLLRVTRAAVHKWIDEGRIKAVTVQGAGKDLHRIPIEEIEAMGLTKAEIIKGINPLLAEAS